MLDRKIELDNLPKEVFEEVMLSSSEEILKIAKDAQHKINSILIRFNIKCDLSLSYSPLTAERSTQSLHIT